MKCNIWLTRLLVSHVHMCCETAKFFSYSLVIHYEHTIIYEQPSCSQTYVNIFGCMNVCLYT